MKKLLVIGTLGLALGLAGNQARAHDELAYFVAGALVGGALTYYSVGPAPVIVHYPVRAPVYYAPVHYAPAPAYYYRPGPPPGYRPHRHPGYRAVQHHGHGRGKRGR